MQAPLVKPFRQAQLLRLFNCFLWNNIETDTFSVCTMSKHITFKQWKCAKVANDAINNQYWQRLIRIRFRLHNPLHLSVVYYLNEQRKWRGWWHLILVCKIIKKTKSNTGSITDLVNKANNLSSRVSLGCQRKLNSAKGGLLISEKNITERIPMTECDRS